MILWQLKKSMTGQKFHLSFRFFDDDFSVVRSSADGEIGVFEFASNPSDQQNQRKTQNHLERPQIKLRLRIFFLQTKNERKLFQLKEQKDWGGPEHELVLPDEERKASAGVATRQAEREKERETRFQMTVQKLAIKKSRPNLSYHRFPQQPEFSVTDIYGFSTNIGDLRLRVRIPVLANCDRLTA